ncbi:hypothetical protein [Hwangdonia lutea]|uniref:DUF4398 domain-containing protein n=1 Tax=Hwangdonia lutea TaxID=3075823 RepID=A0AA97HRH4_9FLAO|nr:hypothetical protein [Hwangdonia sp. SCSIO 19198]WOD43858.1 hypothetical protein RNZ46_01035 [Hwangdonia sp. SCSIO 19198]
MKHYYFLLVLATTLNFNAQTANCDEANSYLVNAYSHVKDAYEANNISHLKYYANRSLEAFKLSKKTLKDCGCEAALKLSNKSIDLLAKVEDSETYEDGRFFVKRARDLSKESVIEIDKCAYSNTADAIDDLQVAAADETNELSDLQKEQLALQKQQEALKLKAAEIKNRLAQQEEKALQLEKEQLIMAYKTAIASNIKSYNEALKVSGCNHAALKEAGTTIDVSTKSIEAIKKHYINTLKTLGSKYLSQLNLCDK